MKENVLQNFSIQSAQIGPVPIPAGFISTYIGRVENFLNDRVSKIPGTYVKSLTIDNGKMNFQGKLPNTEATVK